MSAAVEAFAGRAYGRLAAIDPGFAINAGDLSAGDRLPPGTAGFPLERLTALQALDGEARVLAGSSETTAEERLDLEFFGRAVALESFAQIELGERRHNSDVLSPLGDLLMQVLFAPFEREEERYQKLTLMIDGVPAYLAEAMTTMGPSDPLWHDLAGEVADAFPDLFTVLPEGARGRAGPATLEALTSACAKARGAHKDYRRRLRELVPGASTRILGADRFSRLLELKGIPYDLQDLGELGEQLFRRLIEERKTLARELVMFADPRAAMRRVREQQPASFEVALDDVRVLAQRCRDFVGERSLCDVPSGEELRVVETPAYARPLIPFAAIMPARPLWPVMRSTYYVTRPASGDLAELNDAALHNVVPHEAYPGHHLQYVVANLRGSRLRNLPWTSANAAALGIDCVEGWAHYCEALMLEQGFGVERVDRTVALARRYVFVNDALWRAARILIDVGLATGDMPLDRAMTMLHEEVGLSPDGARSEVRRSTLMPGYNLCYAVGKHLIGELRLEAERAWGRGFSLPRFHDFVMKNGPAPLGLVSARLRIV